MRRSIIVLWCVIYAVCIAITAAAFFVGDTPDWKLFSKGMVLLVTLTCVIFLPKRLVKRHSGDGFLILQQYRNDYPDLLRNPYPDSRRKKRMLEQAIIDLHLDRYRQAIHAFDQLAAENDSRAEDRVTVLYFRGLCQQCSGNYIACADDWEAALQAMPTNAMIWENLGTVYFLHLDQPDKAERCYLTCLSYAPDRAETHASFATFYYLKKNDPQKAISYASRALELNPELFQATSTLALAWRALGNRETSQHYRDIYASHFPNDAAGLDAMLQAMD